ncbi:MAG: DUF3327 domain-containing protein [Chloroflexi bacterium]|nr:DUF3327 domain-containing protein [Chloroflexota bacterium]
MPGWNSFDAFLADVSQAPDEAARRRLVDRLQSERAVFPWIEGNVATFVYRGDAQSVALNLDTIPSDPPFMPLERLPGTDFWYLRYPFEPDDLLDYLLAVDDPGTPLAHEVDVAGRVATHWRADSLNPNRMEAGSTAVSVLRMPDARPFPDWNALRGVPRGSVTEHTIDSTNISMSDRKVWVYTPPGYETAGSAYPVLILQDGQWAAGPLQVPSIADALIKHRRLKPVIIIMVQSATQPAEREREYIRADRYYTFLISELLPFIQTRYRVDMTQVGIGGVAVGAVAAAAAALNNPVVFSRLMLVSMPLGKGTFQDELREIVKRFNSAGKLPARIFQSIGRYESRARFVRPAQALRTILDGTPGLEYRYAELGSGHGLVGFRGILPEALAWVFPGDAFAES